MCGIAGIFYRNRRPVEHACLKAMTDAIAHRGPDGEGFWIDANIGLGHRRLAIREMSELGTQPMHSPDGQAVVVFNGEIYNDHELKEELARDHGCQFRSNSDTEVIPQGYQVWGLELFNRLEGIFAIAVWDKAAKKLVLARDGIGTKPLYYYVDNEVLRFGSEIKALLSDPEQPRNISACDLGDFFKNGYPAPNRSLLKDIKQVAPGHVEIFDLVSESSHQYWRLSRSGEIRDLGTALSEFNSLFQKVLTDQLVSDVPLGVLQSGGIDSSLISYELKSIMKVPLYCVGFDDKSYDETVEAQLVANETGHPLHIIKAGQDGQKAEDVFRAMVHHSDGQLADSSAFPMYLVNQAIAKDARVALSGDGADEFFGGYQTYMATQMAEKVIPFLPSPIWRELGYIARRAAGVSDARIPKSEKLARFFLGLSSPVPHASWRNYLQPREKQLLFDKDMQQDPIDGYGDVYKKASGNTLDKALLADQQYYLPGDMLIKTDRMSMAHAVEIRVPFLDRRIMDFAGRLHSDLLLSAKGETKILLRKALQSKAAHPRISKRPKTGFNYPVNQLLANDLNPLAKRLFVDDADNFAPYLKPDAVRALWQDHISGKINHNYLLWALLVFGLWREKL